MTVEDQSSPNEEDRETVPTAAREKGHRLSAAIATTQNGSHVLRQPKAPAKRNSVSYTVRGSFIVPLLLVFLSPVFVMLFSYTIVKLNGSPSALVKEISHNGFLSTLYNAWVPYMFGSTMAWKFILSFIAFELILMRVLPGKWTTGPTTPAGNVPVYKANGMLAYVCSLVAYVVAGHILGVFNPADIYDHYLEFIGAMNFCSLVFCLLLYFKGRLSPSSTDCGTSGHFLFDYYWGTELYPRVLGWDIKMFTNCRFGLMGWSLLILSYATKQYQTHGLSDSMAIAVLLQLAYITKFFHWEMGYMKSLDIMHDRAGYYLVSVCLCLHSKNTGIIANGTL